MVVFSIHNPITYVIWVRVTVRVISGFTSFLDPGKVTHIRRPVIITEGETNWFKFQVNWRGSWI